MIRRIALLLAFCACPEIGNARQILDLDIKHQPVALADWGDQLVDAEGKMTLRSVLSQKLKATTSITGYEQLPIGAAHWIRFTVPPAPDAQRWYLRLATPHVEYATLYTLQADGQWTDQSAGDLEPMHLWPVPHWNVVLPLSISAAEPTHYVLRVKPGVAHTVPVDFISESYLSDQTRARSLAYGLYFGFLFMVFLFAVIHWWALREKSQAYFAAWALAATLSVSAQVGLLRLEIWPQTPVLNAMGRHGLPLFAMACWLLFVGAILHVRVRSHWRHEALVGMAFIVALLGLASPWLSPASRFILTPLLLSIALLYAFSVQCWALYRGERFALYLLAGFVPLLIAAPYALGDHFGLIGKASAWTLLVVQACLAVSMASLAFLLNLYFQHQLDQNRRIALIEEIDPTTGLLNESVFERRLPQLAERATRLKQDSAVAILDLSNLEDLRKEFGRRQTVEMILRVTARLNGMTREMDSVARLAEGRFGILIEGPFDPSRAASLGGKVLAICLGAYSGLPQGMVPKVKVAVAVVPRSDIAPEELLMRLHARLDRAAQAQGKNIFVDTET